MFWLVLRCILYSLIGVMFIVQVILRVIRHYWRVPAPAFATQLIDNPLRRRFIQKPETIAKNLHTEPGMTVVEIGPGKGSYTVAVANMVKPDGKVYAVDIQEKVIKRLELKLQREGVENVISIIDDVYNLGFQDESVDRVFAIACIAEIPEPVRALREFHRILKEDGIASFSELLPDPDYPRRATMIKWAEEAGFILSESYGNFFVYQLNFVKNMEDTYVS